ncbi:MFS transporter [Vibrio sonorensis]|uniref:MFS transporter n=1 Tax=Vibrio sonorensis TaxID=1004316 RepID=UPI0008D9B844|nr:MFS transporter [Vibrio sonorensis]
MTRHVWVLSLCQALLMSGNILLISIVGLVGQQLAPNASMITFPVGLQFVGLMLATVPASMIMAKTGRKVGFSIGNLVGICGAALTSLGVYQNSFIVFCAGCLLLGIGIGFATLYRFAAMEVCEPEARERALSISMAGGVLAALLGPNLALWSKGLIVGHDFLGAFLAIIALNIVSMIILQSVKFKSIHSTLADEKPDRLSDIIKAPNFLLAVVAATVSYAVMNILMTATPLAMIGCGFDFSKAAGVIEWHVLGMFVPAFFTGRLIEKFGNTKMIVAGGLLFIVCIAINIHGVSIWHFTMALVLLGVGWNFMFISATSLFSQTYLTKNRAKAQACNEFIVFSSVALTAMLSGWLEATIGWQALNLYVLPFVIAVILGIIFASKRNVERTA